VRRDRRGHPYLFCANHPRAKLLFTHGSPAKVKRLIARTRAPAAARGELARSLQSLHFHYHHHPGATA
jgi:hypothetical protein